jgi:ribose 5-phosphate isomerase B
MVAKPKVLVLPMAGYGKRFVDAGYSLPKQFLRLNGSSCLIESLSSLDLNYFDKVIVGCRAEFDRAYNCNAYLQKHYGSVSFSTVTFDQDTRGSLETVALMLKEQNIAPNAEVTVFTLDVKFQTKTPMVPLKVDAEVLVVKTNNAGFSFVEFESDNGFKVTKTAEKRIISDYGAVGLYRFLRCDTLLNMIDEELKGQPNHAKEFYICPIYNRYIADGLSVKGVEAESMIMFGTPAEYEFCRTLRDTNGKRISMASDHSGFSAKEIFSEVAIERGYFVDDFGCYSDKPCDYDDFVRASAKSITDNRNNFGISFCRSGQGVNLSASCVNNVRSVIIYDLARLEECLRHNAPNHFSIPSNLVTRSVANSFFDSLESVEFEGGRHQDRLVKLFDENL